jgi:hypothetical protein
MTLQFAVAEFVDITDEQLDYLKRCGPFINREELAAAVKGTLNYFQQPTVSDGAMMQVAKQLLDNEHITLDFSRTREHLRQDYPA